MMITKRITRWLAPGAILLLALACTTQQQAEPFTPPEPTAAPDIAATVAARDRAMPQGGPLPTPAPAQVSQAAGEFASSYAALSQQWDRVRRDLDGWRQGLTSCEASSVQVALRGFSGGFSGVSQAANGLSRHPSVRDMSDRLIEAAQKEEAALRRLRDNWQPGQAGPALVSGPAPASSHSNGNGAKDNGGAAVSPARPGFEGVAQARAGALALRQRVADQLSDLQGLTGVDAEARVAAFVTAFDALSVQWDRFHADYDAFRAVRPSLTPERSLSRLNALVEQHREIVLAHRALPSATNTRYVSDLLAAAVRDEDSALRRLRGSFRQDGRQDGRQVGEGGESAPAIGQLSGLPGPPPAGETEKDGNGMEEGAMPEASAEGPSDAEVNIQAGDPGLFDAFDERMARTNDALRQAGIALDAAASEASPGGRAAVAGFTTGYDALLRQWDGFHGGYDTWMAAEGGCDRAAVTAAIGGFALRMGDIATSARQLPRAAPLRTLGELAVEAARREEEALRQLRGDWSPFDASVYRELDAELTASGRMRRQVSLGIQELLERYGISGS